MAGDDNHDGDHPESSNTSPPVPPPIQQIPHTVSSIKLSILKKGEYDIWAMKMEHYLSHTDYPIWQVIQNDNGHVSVTTDTNRMIKVLPSKTDKEVVAGERERKARTTLLMALPEDHLAKFHNMTDAIEMWEAIKSRFYGNDKSKKMQKYLLKQQFEGFSMSTSEGLHKGYDRSLPSFWSHVALIMRTKPGLDTLSFDDLYNTLRVFERDVNGITASSSNTQNVAFMSADNTSSTNDVSTTYNVSSPAPQLDYNDLEQINNDDIEEIDLKWQGILLETAELKGIKTAEEEMLSTMETKLETMESDLENTYVNDRYAAGMHTVPLPMIGNYMPSGLKNAPKVVYEPKVWTDAPIIEEYESDSDNDSVSNVQEDKEKPSFVFTDSVKHVKTSKENVKESSTPNYSPKIGKQGRNVNVARQNYSSQAASTSIASKVNTARPFDDPHRALKDKGVVDSGCSRHITGNKAHLTNYQEFKGSSVAFGGSNERITGKGKIKAGKLDFEDVYYVEELKHYNLFFVSQMCDKKNKVLFTDTDCLVLSYNFKLPDENQVLLKIPRQHNMYSFNLKNIDPSRDLACLFAKASIDKSNKWHRRLGHVNFKKLNKLVKGNLVRGLPFKIFENDHTCVACQKGKQHKASCKAKTVSSVNQPLQILHMDLFRPTSVGSINHKTCCLVITDGFTKFSWVYFLKSKDKTTPILKDFIRQVVNQFNHKVKTIRSDNRTEFKNNELIELCGLKGIKREYSNARTPQQNEVAERKNMTLIEAARTMLADLFLPTTFWAEAVNTACYVLNRVLVTKPQNKTPYELLSGKKPIISYLRPFGCHVTILNTIDQLGKFDGKSDLRFLVGYSLNRKAFRVYNLETKRVKENLHVKFLENKPNVVGKGHAWMFDHDYLTNSMKYEPVLVENQANKSAGLKEANNYAGTQANDDQEELEKLKRQEKEANDAARKETTHENQNAHTNSTNLLNTVSIPLSVVGPSRAFNVGKLSYLDDPLMPHLEDIYASPSEGIFTESSYDDEGVRSNVSCSDKEKVNKNSEAHALVYRNKKDERGVVVRNKARLVAQGHRQEEGIDYDEVFAHVARMEAIKIFLAFAFYMGFIFYQMDVKSTLMYGTIDEEVYVTQPHGFVDPKFPNKAYKVVKALYGLHQDPRAWYATLSTFFEQSGYRRGAIEKTLFIKQDKKDILLVQVYVDDIIFGSIKKSCVKIASTPIETRKPFVKDEEAADVDVHLYRSMIGSLMYLTASRPDIMFAACACSRFQVTPKTSHLQAMKRIFRYLKGQPKLGIWYLNVSSFNLEAYSDSDYAGVNLDRKSITGGCQFLGKILISWQCKKHTIVATSTIEAEYVAAAYRCGQVLWLENQLLDYGFNIMNTKIYIDNESTICIVKNPVFHSKTKHIEIRHHFIRDAYEKKLIQGRIDDVSAATKDVNTTEPTVFDDENTMTIDQTLIKMKAKKARLLDEKIAKRLHDEEVEQAAASEKQEKDDLEKKYQSLKRKPVSIAQARKNMIIYLKNMTGYKMEHVRVPTVDKEKALWVELTRLFEPNANDVFWKLQRHDIFMLTEKDYPLSNAVMIMMLSAKLQVEEDSEMARDLVMKIFMEANKPKSRIAEIEGVSTSQERAEGREGAESTTTTRKNYNKSCHTTKEMTWHATGKCTKPDKMKHPVDGRAWKNLDTKYLDFVEELMCGRR
nr:putative ribonuclease H-like domain-containing protein [Tanacetum cinerariifolium]